MRKAPVTVPRGSLFGWLANTVTVDVERVLMWSMGECRVSTASCANTEAVVVDHGISQRAIVRPRRWWCSRQFDDRQIHAACLAIRF